MTGSGTSTPGRDSAAPSRPWTRPLEALRVGEALRRQLGRSVPVAPALVFPDMERDRRMERLASWSSLPLLWTLDRYTARLAETAIDPHFRQSLEKSLALAEMSALVESSAAGAGSFRLMSPSSFFSARRPAHPG